MDLFHISLAQWSLHRKIQEGDLAPIDFPAYTRDEFNIKAVEYVNGFFPDREPDIRFAEELKQRAEDAGVLSLLIMIDRAGDLGDPDAQARALAVENHMQWAEVATHLGCHSIRVNAHSKGTPHEQASLVSDGLSRLTEAVAPTGLNVLVENHGGLSSNADWLIDVIQRVNQPTCGTLPDFGNFFLNSEMTEWYDRYNGVSQMMPYAKAVSAKSNDFDDEGNEIHTDYDKMIGIVLDTGYNGYIGIEYEGQEHSEDQGIKLTQSLLARVAERRLQSMSQP
jgi:sugar phosphate isomerase/epimerase